MLANALAAGWLGDVLDFIDTRTQQPPALPAPILRSRAAVTECAITKATNGAAPACSIEPSATAVQFPVARLPDP
jgi:hypothetical protein